MSISAKDVMALRQKTGVGMMDCKKALVDSDGDFEAAEKLLREKGMSAAKKREGRSASEGRIIIKKSDDGNGAVMVDFNSETDFVSRNELFVNLANSLADQALVLAGNADDNNLIAVDSFDLSGVTDLSGKLGEKMVLARAGYLAAGAGEMVEVYMHPGDQLGVMIKLNGDDAAIASDSAKELAHDLALQIAAASPLFVRSNEVPQEKIDAEVEIYKTQMRNEGKPEEMLEKIAMGKINKYYTDVCLINQLYVKEQKQKVSERIKEAAAAAGGNLDVVSFLRFKVGEGS